MRNPPLLPSSSHFGGMQQGHYGHGGFGGGGHGGAHGHGRGGYQNHGHGGGHHGGHGEGAQSQRKHGARRSTDAQNCITQHMVWRAYRPGGLTLQPHSDYVRRVLPPYAMKDCPASCIATYWVKTSINKQRSPVNCISWTPEGPMRCITGNSSGEFTLWKSPAHNFERIMQAHDSAIRAMTWSHSGSYMITADNGGIIKYWEPSMTNVQAFVAHGGQPVRALSFSPRDTKFVSCSDDSTLRVWDWELYREERVLQGHGWDVKTAEWHPYKSLVASGSKDNLIKLWDPRVGTALSSLYGHKNTVMKVTWNGNGNWLLTCSRDQLIKLYDIRTMRDIVTFKGHGKDVTSICWHPQHESLFLSGAFDGSLIYWVVGHDAPQAIIPMAHDDTAIWDIGWHPMGHVVATGSNDHTVKFWVRNRPGDPLGILPEVDEEGNAIAGTGGSAFETGHQQHGDAVPEGHTSGPGMGVMKAAASGGMGTKIMPPPPPSASANPPPPPKVPPPEGYICNRCGVKGHYIQDCPQAHVPPPNYVCHTCGQRGHFRGDCPTRQASGGGAPYGGGGYQHSHNKRPYPGY